MKRGIAYLAIASAAIVGVSQAASANPAPSSDAQISYAAPDGSPYGRSDAHGEKAGKSGPRNKAESDRCPDGKVAGVNNVCVSVDELDISAARAAVAKLQLENAQLRALLNLSARPARNCH